MLSRVAENIYWMARYLERTEGIARLVSSSSQLLFDLPRNTPLSWGSMVDILGTDDALGKLKLEPNESGVMRLLISEPKFPNSLISVLRRARENARISRDILPGELWECINELHHYVADTLPGVRSRSARHDFLHQVISGCQRINGVIAGTLSRGTLYSFVGLGQALERADMTSRIVDVRSANLLPRDALDPYANLGWMNVLKSLSGYEMFQHEVQTRISGEQVAPFLLQSPHFPRSYRYCLDRVASCLAHLPNSAEPLSRLDKAQLRLRQSALAEGDLDHDVHTLVDLLQQDLNGLHTVIMATYFRPTYPEAVA